MLTEVMLTSARLISISDWTSVGGGGDWIRLNMISVTFGTRRLLQVVRTLVTLFVDWTLL